MDGSRATDIRRIAERLEEIEPDIQKLRDGWDVSSVILTNSCAGTRCVGMNDEAAKLAVAALVLAALTAEAKMLWDALGRISRGEHAPEGPSSVAGEGVCPIP